MLARIREVQEQPDGYLDLWARDHRKSTIITFAKTIQDILASHGESPLPQWDGMEPTFGIFSHTRGIAAEFARQIKQELEQNDTLKSLFPDVLYENPERDAPRWSVQNGLTVRRKSNPKEGTVEAWGLVDGQPTSKHFNVLIYDDVVTKESVTTPEMIKKTTESWELSLNLGDRNPRIRGIGTRYHFADTWRAILERGALTKRQYAATDDGTLTGNAVYLTQKELQTKIQNMGPYTACFPGYSPVLMADGSQRPIAGIKPGDVVIGFETGKGFGSKGKLRPAVVKSIGTRVSPVQFVCFESGEHLECTPDHKFFTGRAGSDHHRIYAPFGFGYHDLKIGQRVYRPSRIADVDREAAAYLRGIIDGEGHINKAGTVTICQSPEHNPEVCARIEECLKALGIAWKAHDRPASNENGRNAKAGRIYRLYMRRCDKVWMLNAVRPAKAQRLCEDLCTGMKSTPDRVTAILPMTHGTVYNIETETGNYIAWGVMAKNSAQLLQNPIADSKQTFKRDWLEHRFLSDIDWSGMTRVLLADPANDKKKKSDYTTMAVIGLGQDRNYYLLDFLRDRLNLKERGAEYFRLHRKWKPHRSAYEEYGIQGDIQYMQTMMEGGNGRSPYHFEIEAVGGSLSKVDRINRLIPVCAESRFWMPDVLMRTNSEGKLEELIAILVEQEFLAWPVPVHDDGLDVIARVFDVLDLEFPDAEPEPTRDDRYRKRRSAGSWMAG